MPQPTAAAARESFAPPDVSPRTGRQVEQVAEVFLLLLCSIRHNHPRNVQIRLNLNIAGINAEKCRRAGRQPRKKSPQSAALIQGL